MRERLKAIDWHVYGLSVEDLDHIMQITRDFAAHRRAYMDQVEAQYRAESPDQADDILDGILPYLTYELYYLWEACILRLMGIFEGVVERQFLPPAQYHGYRSRIRALKGAGYEYSEKDVVEDWVKLRNAIAHSPPERFRPHMIEEADAQECCNLLKCVLTDLLAQQTRMAASDTE